MAYQYGGRDIAQLSLTYSWGLSPGSATITLPGELSTAVGDTVALTFGGMNFHGIIAQNPVSTDQGMSTQLQVVDNRIKLMWDDVRCSFNNAEVREDNPATPGIDRQKRFWHILPANWETAVKTWTDGPYSAGEIIDMLLAAASVLNSWTTSKHAAQSKPVYNIDANNGAKLGNVLQEITEQQGLVFTLIGEDQLTWARKGDGSILAFPANSTDRKDGDALSNNDTKVMLVGDRNRYQDMPVDLEPDWNAGYEGYWIEPAWLAEVATRYSLPETTLAEQAALFAKARSVTLREYVTQRGDPAYADYGTWGEVGRMEIPVWVYLQDIVWKAYRIPPSYAVNGISRASLEINDGLLAACTFDVDTGAIAIKTPVELYPDSKAFVVAKGQPLDALDPRTQSAITLAQLNGARDRWSAQNKYNIDVKNFCVIFEHAMFIPGADAGALLLFPNQGTDIAEDDPLYNLAVPNAGVTVAAASVRAAMVFSAERYNKVFGSGVRAGSKYVGALSYHALMTGGVFQSEVKYADDKGADEKATEYAAALTAQESVYRCGGYTRHGTVGTILSGVIDRVTINMEWGEAITERVEYTKERAQSNFEHERDLDRKAKARDLFPGQKSNRVDVERLVLIAKLSRELKRVSPTSYGQMSDVLQVPVGSVNSSVSSVKVDGEAGEVVWQNGSFAGIVIAAGHAAGHIRAVATNGTVPVRVQGPFTSGQTVGCASSADGARSAIVDGDHVVGVVVASYAGSDVVLAPVQISASRGAVNEVYCLQVYRSPFTGMGEPPDDQARRVKVRTGWLNTILPENINTEIVCADDAATWIWLEAAFNDTGDLLTCTIESGDTLPVDPDGTPDHAPPVSRRTLARVTVAGGSITEILHDRRGSRDVKKLVTKVECEHLTLEYSWGGVVDDATEIRMRDFDLRLSALEP